MAFYLIIIMHSLLLTSTVQCVHLLNTDLMSTLLVNPSDIYDSVSDLLSLGVICIVRVSNL